MDRRLTAAWCTPRPVPIPSFNLESKDDAYEVTMVLGTMLRMLKVLKVDIETFFTSRCWQNQVSRPGKMYGPDHFIISVRYYLATICNQSLLAIRRIIEDFPWPVIASINVDPSSRPTLKNYIRTVDMALQALLVHFTGLVGRVNKMPLLTTPPSEVPSVSPREVLYWCLANTRDFRAKLTNAAATRHVLADLTVHLGIEIDKAQITPEFLDPTGLEHKKPTEIDQCTPYVYSFCSGRSSGNARIHEVTYIGATQERFTSWRGLRELRNGARKINLQEAVDAWKQYYGRIRKVEKERGLPPSNERTTTAQKRVLTVERRKIVNRQIPEPQVQALQRLRDMREHLCQAYSEKPNHSSFAFIGCCYACKLTMSYDEANRQPNDEHFLGGFNMKDRGRNPSSCAEILSSAYCMLH